MDRSGKIAILNKYVPVKEKDIFESKIDFQGKNIMNLRDALIELGTVLEEDCDNQIYVATIPSGIANKNEATVLFNLHENELEIISYAKEGLINQHSAEKAVANLKKYMQIKYQDC